MPAKIGQILQEALIWGLAWGISGTLAGAGLGALLSGGDYFPATLLGSGYGLIFGVLGGAIVALLLEGGWASVAYLGGLIGTEGN